MNHAATERQDYPIEVRARTLVLPPKSHETDSDKQNDTKLESVIRNRLMLLDFSGKGSTDWKSRVMTSTIVVKGRRTGFSNVDLN